MSLKLDIMNLGWAGANSSPLSLLVLAHLFLSPKICANCGIMDQIAHLTGLTAWHRTNHGKSNYTANQENVKYIRFTSALSEWTREMWKLFSIFISLVVIAISGNRARKTLKCLLNSMPLYNDKPYMNQK